MSKRAWIVLAVVASLVGIGCVIVTGGTDGYQSYPPCTNASECPDNSVCCVEFSGASVAQTCKPASEGCVHQLCATSSECQGLECIQQSCSYQDASTDAFSACGILVPNYCAPIGADAGTDAASDSPVEGASDAAPE